MATLIDAVSMLKKLGFYETVFPFILVLALIFGVLERFKPFGPNRVVNGTVATIVALFFISITRVSSFLANLIPLITAFLIILVFLILIFMFIGVKEETIAKAIFEHSEGYGILLIIFVMLVFVVLSQVFPEQALMTQMPGAAKSLNISLYPADATASEKAAAMLSAQTGAIIFSPKIMALIAMMVTFAVAVYYIVRDKKY